MNVIGYVYELAAVVDQITQKLLSFVFWKG